MVNGQAVTLRSPSYSTERSADMTTAGGPVVALAALADRAAGEAGETAADWLACGFVICAVPASIL